MTMTIGHKASTKPPTRPIRTALPGRARWAGTAVLLALLVNAVPSEATVVTGTFTAVMNSGSTDSLGYFGGGDLGGDTILGAFSYDTANLASNSCAVVAGEGCFKGPVVITATIAGHSVTFHGDPSIVPYGVNQYGGFPATSSNTDEFTISSLDALGVISVTMASKTKDFIPDGTNPATSFSLSSGDFDGSSGGTITFPPLLITETLSFQFTGLSASAQATAGNSTDVPEPTSLMLLGSALVGAAVIRRRLR